MVGALVWMLWVFVLPHKCRVFWAVAVLAACVSDISDLGPDLVLLVFPSFRAGNFSESQNGRNPKFTAFFALLLSVPQELPATFSEIDGV